jgi:hypothetical protein
LEFENEDSDFADDNSDNEEERKLADKVDNEDVRFMMPEHMPSYLRIDKDIKQHLIQLSKLVKDYSQFDVIGLDREINRKLEFALDR